MEKYAVFIDIDGTYTFNSPTPVAKNVAAINRVRAKGHMVFINTGRSYGTIPKEVLAATELDGCVAGGGSYILLKNKLIKNDRIPKDLLIRFTSHLMNRKLCCIYEGEDSLLSINDDSANENCQRVTSPTDFIDKYKDVAITKLTLFGEVSQSDEEILHNYMHLIRFPNYSEAIIIGNSKATGIAELLKLINIPQSHCIAIGDSLNDIEMIKYAGIGVAMGNACDELKAIADYTTCSAEYGGVAEVLNRFLP